MPLSNSNYYIEPDDEKEKDIKQEEKRQPISEFYNEHCQKVISMYRIVFFKKKEQIPEFNKAYLDKIRPKMQEEILQTSGTEFLKKYNIITPDEKDINNFHFNIFFKKMEEECLIKIFLNI